MTFSPVADTYVDESKPGTSFGAGTALRVDASPVRTAYLRFDVQGASDFSSATLRVFVASNTTSGFEVRPVADTGWSQAMTFDTAPPFGDAVASSGPVAAGTWVDLDVSSLVSGNGPVSMALTTASSTAIRLASSESANPPELIVPGTAPADSAPPTPPGTLTAPSIEPFEVDLTWTAAADDVAVVGYTVYRDGTAIATVDGGTLAYADTSVSPQTAYQYAVDASDAAGNHSELSNVVDLATPQVPSTLVAYPDADAYVNADKPNGNYGSATALRVDASPDVRSYLRFTVRGVTGEVTQATLRLRANSGSPAGFSVRGVADNGWDEGTITYANAPAVGSVVRSSGALSKGSVEIDVSPLVSGNGTYTIALTTPGSTAVSFVSRDGTSSYWPELSVTQGAVGEPPPAPAPPIVGAADPYQVRLSWDSVGGAGVGVAGYTVYRDGSPIAAVDDGTDVYTDTTVLPGTTYGYALDAYDAAGNHSARSDSVSVTTPALPATFTLVPDADAYVNADLPDTNYGSAAELRVDGSPDVHGYLRFTVRGLTADTAVRRATLRLYPSKHSSSVWSEAHGVADNGWDEGTITYANAPAVGSVVGSSQAVSPDGRLTFDDIDVTSLVSGNGTFSVALTTPGPTAIKYTSREAAGVQPELIVETGPPAPPPPTSTVFSDGFETGALGQWHQTDLGLVATQDIVKNGSWAARATSTSGTHAYAVAPLAGSALEATYTTWFDVLSRGDNTLYLLRARRSLSSPLVGVYVTATGRLATRNEAGAGDGSQTSTTSVGPGWHLLKLHLVVGGSSGSLTEVWLDGTLAVTRTDSLGSDPVGAVEIGDRGYHIGDVAFDDVEVTAP